MSDVQPPDECYGNDRSGAINLRPRPAPARPPCPSKLLTWPFGGSILTSLCIEHRSLSSRALREPGRTAPPRPLEGLKLTMSRYWKSTKKQYICLFGCNVSPERADWFAAAAQTRAAAAAPRFFFRVSYKVDNNEILIVLLFRQPIIINVKEISSVISPRFNRRTDWDHHDHFYSSKCIVDTRGLMISELYGDGVAPTTGISYYKWNPRNIVAFVFVMFCICPWVSGFE